MCNFKLLAITLYKRVCLPITENSAFSRNQKLNHPNFLYHPQTPVVGSVHQSSQLCPAATSKGISQDWFSSYTYNRESRRRSKNPGLGEEHQREEGLAAEVLKAKGNQSCKNYKDCHCWPFLLKMLVVWPSCRCLGFSVSCTTNLKQV